MHLIREDEKISGAIASGLDPAPEKAPASQPT
jgi:hypothetical protein